MVSVIEKIAAVMKGLGTYNTLAFSVLSLFLRKIKSHESLSQIISACVISVFEGHMCV